MATLTARTILGLETNINCQPFFDLDKHQEGKLGHVNWGVVYEKCTPPLYDKSLNLVTDSGPKKLNRILFLPDIFIHMILAHLLYFMSMVSFLFPCFPQILATVFLLGCLLIITYICF